MITDRFVTKFTSGSKFVRLPTRSIRNNPCEPLGFCRVSLSGQLLDANPQFCQLVGYSLSELQQLSFAALFFPSSISTSPPGVTDWPYSQEIALIDKAGRVIQTCATCLLEKTAPNAEPHRLFLMADIVAHELDREAASSHRQLDLSRAIHAIHSASDRTEILRVTAYWCQALLPNFSGIGAYGFRDSWQWVQFYRPSIGPSSKQPTMAGWADLDSDDVTAYLRQGKRVKLQSSPLSAPLMSDCPVGDLKNEVEDEVVVLLSSDHSLEVVGSSSDTLLIPIQTQEDLWGVVVLSQAAEASDRFRPLGTALPMSEVEHALALSDHAALAIAQTKRCEDLQQRGYELTRWVHYQTQHLQQALNFEAAIKRITEKIRDSLNEQYIFETVIRELCETLVLDHCTVGFYNLEQQTVEIRYEHATTDDCYPLKGCVDPMAANAAIYIALCEGNCIQFSARTTSCDRLAVSQNTTLACPITDGQQVIGDLWLSRPKYSAFNEQERRLLQQVTSQCAIGLRQARLYEASQAQIKSLETLGDLKDDFLSTVSHELRTPITNIKMTVKMLELALDRRPASEARILQYLEILRTETQRELTLINDLLDLQRLDSGSQVLELSHIELAPWISQIVNGFRERAENNQQQLRLTAITELTYIVSDEDCLKRIIAELINNACKYTPPQEIISIDVHLSASGLQLSVSNSGIVIPVAEQKQVFEKFYRIRGSDQRKKGGTGLGLALIRQLAQHLNGDISLSSGDNLTSFTLKLPPLEMPDAQATDLK